MPIWHSLTAAERSTAIVDITDEAAPRASFYVLVLLSTAIASYGLLANSTAVVIGAMLIAPLMGPIYGIALGLIRDDRKLLFQASAAEGIGIALAVGLAVAIGLLPLRPEFGSEVLARTKPNLYDLLVAIAAGVAGAYARTSHRVSPTLPGVAIATALVPPLAVCGLCLSDGRWDAASGAFLLFTTNLLAIEIAAGIVFVMAGLALRTDAGSRSLADMVRRFAIPVVLLIPIAAFLLQTLALLVRDDRLAKNLRAALRDNLQSISGADVTEIRHERRDDRLDVVAVVLTPQTIEPALVSQIEADLRRRIDPAAHLVVRSLISRDADGTGQVFLDDALRQRLRSERERQSFLSRLSAGLRTGLDGVPGAELVDVQREQRDSNRVRATVRASVVMDPARVGVMQAAAAKATGVPIELVVRSVMTRDANQQAFLDEDLQTVLLRRARAAIEKTLLRVSPELELLALRIDGDEQLTATATIAGAKPLGRAVTAEMGREVLEAVGRPTGLMVKFVRTTNTAARAAAAAAAKPSGTPQP